MQGRNPPFTASLGTIALAVFALSGCSNDIVGPAWMSDAGGSAGMPNGGSAGTPNGGGNAGTPSGGGGGSAGTGGSAPQSGLPCEVASMLAQHCVSCHGEDPPGLLLTHADLSASSHTDPSRSVAQEALARIESTGRDHMPPPPTSPLDAAGIAAFRAWLDEGAPPRSCGDPIVVGPDPYDTPVVCTSGQLWTGGDRESPLMHPGGACIDCHTREDEGPTLAIAGTLYPTPHEPTDCNGVSSTAGASVIITDAAGIDHRLNPNAAGNFSIETEEFAFPYTARVSYQGRERIMVGAQDDGDCNGCHTEAGASDAPGRIFLP